LPAPFTCDILLAASTAALRKPALTGRNINSGPTPVFGWSNPMKDETKGAQTPYGWVLISKLTELTGYTDDAIRAKKKRREWTEGRHWRKAPDNRVVFHVPTIQAWMEGRDA
jgi:hypothetical protein